MTGGQKKKKRIGTAYGFLDSRHDLAEHSFDAERVLLTDGPMVGLVRHYCGREKTRSRERGKEWGSVRV